MKRISRMLGLFLLVALLVAAMGIMANAEKEDAQTLTLDVAQTIQMTEGGENSQWFSFVPETAGAYLFYSSNITDEQTDPWAVLHDSDNGQLAHSEDSGDSRNFAILEQLEAGETYYLYACGSNAREGSFQVQVTQVFVEGITIDPVTMLEGTGGGVVTTESGIYYEYHWWEHITGTVLYTGGATAPIENGAFLYNGISIRMQGINGQFYANHWTAGNTYTAEVDFLGEYHNVDVTIEDVPVTNIQLDAITLTENMDGNWGSAWDDETQQFVEVFTYDWWNHISGTVTFEDGSTEQIENRSFTYQGQQYFVDCMDTQSARNQWTLGNTYTPQFYAAGYAGQVSVTISTMQATEMVFGQGYPAQLPGTSFDTYLSFTPETSGSYTFISCDREYGDPYACLYDSSMNKLVTSDDEAGNMNFMITAELEAGKTYYLQLCNNQDTDSKFTAKVVQLAVQEIDLDPITMKAGVYGFWANFEDPDGTREGMYYYDWWDYVTGTVTFADGTECFIESLTVTYEGMQFPLSYDYFQQRNEGGWFGGNTYTPKVTLLGKEYEVSVTIEPSNVVHVDFNPVYVIENIDGAMETDWDPNAGNYTPEYFKYSWHDRLSGTVTFADGTQKKFVGNLVYQGRWYQIDVSDPQSYNNQWTVGNTYDVTVALAGTLWETTVTVEPFPIASMTVEPIIFKANSGGYWDSHWVEETGSYVDYYEYEWQDLIRYTVVTPSGEIIEGTGSSFYYRNMVYRISGNFYQGYWERMEPGNVYEKSITVMVLGKTVPVTIAVLNPQWEAGFEYLVYDGKAIICGSDRTDEILTIPQTLGGYPVTAVDSLGEAIGYAREIVIPDCITRLGNELFAGAAARKITVGKGVADYNWSGLRGASSLQQVVISGQNPSYVSVDGVVYNKDITKLLFVPVGKTTSHTVPDSVTDVEDLIKNIDSYKNLDIKFGQGVQDYKIIDGAVYNKDVTQLHYVNKNTTGDFIMPSTVESVPNMAFADSAYESVTLSSKVTELVYGTFRGCTNLRSVTLPEDLKTLGTNVFADCGSLQAVVIPAGVENIQTAFLKSSVSHIFYKGTEEQWNNMEKWFDVGQYTVHCNATGNEMTLSTEGDQLKMHCSICDEWTVITKPVKPLKLVRQPLSNSAYSGENITITVEAEGEGLTYQWYFKNPGASKFSLTTSFTGKTYSVQMSDSRNGRQVYCVITDKNGNSVQTDTVTLSMRTPLAVEKLPASVAASSGDTAKVSVNATGDGLTYKWYFKNPGSAKFSLTTSYTDDSYSVKMSASRSGRQVYCVITDKYGNSVQTETVTLSMADPVKITKQPANVKVGEGQTAKVSVTATGEGLTYQWYYKNKSASKFSLTTSFTGASYSAKMDSTRNGRQVYCVITDKYGNSVTTKTVTLSMAAAPKVTKQPVSVKVGEGQTAKVSFTASGEGLTYQWYFKNPGSAKFSLTTSYTGTSYSANMNASRNGRQVYCVITDKYGNSVTTETVTLSMGEAVKITKQPVSVKVGEGQTAKVSFTATGDGLTYKWYYKNKSASKFSLTTSFTGASYSAKMDSTRNGRQVYCVITDAYGNSVTTETVTLSMAAAPKVTKQPVSVKVGEGQTAKVSFTASGEGLTYKWYFKNPGATKFSLTTSFTGTSYSVKMSASRSGRQVYCVITDKYGNSVQTETVTLSMASSVKITKQPVSVSVASGTTAKVSVTATGEGLTYKWYYKNKGASKFSLTTSFTGASYSVKMDASRDGRQVYCVITDKYGNSVKTNTVTLSKK